MTRCSRCGRGVDSDGDGNCELCARISDASAAKVKAAFEAAEAARPLDQTTCPHEDFLAAVTVNRLLTGDGTGADREPRWWMAEIRVKCARCDLPFEWVGSGLPYGLLKDRPTTDPSRQELRAPLVPKGREALPGVGFVIGFGMGGEGGGRPN